MTKKKRELIEILLDNVNPECWPEHLPYAAQDKCDSAVYVYSGIPDITSIYNGSWHPGLLDCELIRTADVICKFWNKTIITRDEFVKRWNERNAQDVKKAPQQLALEKFGTDWHENDGVQPVSDEVLIDAIVDGVIDHGVKMERYTWNTLGLFEIKKWRVHSDTNTTTPPTQKESHTEETKPIQQDTKATDTQIGGDHYTKLAIQPMRYSMENGLDALQHTVIKYVTRFRDKNGIEDLEKAKHCIDMLIEFESNKS